MAKKLNYADLYTLRKDGRYQGYYKDADGVRHAVCDKDPQKLYERIQAKETPKEITFGELAEEWEQEHVSTLSEGTQASYKAPLKYVVSLHGEKPIKDVTAQDIGKTMLTEKDNGYSYKHAACVLSMYKQIFNYAIVNGYISVNPAQAIKVPRGMKKGSRKAPEDDLIVAIQKAKKHEFGLFPLFLLYTGFRVGEAMGVKWEDIDTKQKRIYCRRAIENRFGKPYEKQPKTEAGIRWVPLLPLLEKSLKKPKTAKDSDYIFGVDGRPMTTAEMRSRWTAWAKSIGYTELHETTIHDKQGNDVKKTYTRATIDRHMLRHGYATVLYEAGIDELTAQELMGHADISTTHKIYTHLRQKHKESAADKIATRFAQIAVDGNADGKNVKSIDIA